MHLSGLVDHASFLTKLKLSTNTGIQRHKASKKSSYKSRKACIYPTIQFLVSATTTIAAMSHI